MNRQPIVAGNWKMVGTTDSIQQLIQGLIDRTPQQLTCQVVVCPPSIFIPQVVSNLASPVAVGAQNASQYPQGAYTGELAMDMVRGAGCDFVILGHSERRSLFGETNEHVAQKVQAALKADLIPILCVGETLEQRDSGSTLEVIERQLQAVVTVIGADSLSQLVIAYEPVWAIGTGKTASPMQAQEVHVAIRTWVAERNQSAAESIRILYGGSVKPDNAAELFAQPDIDGGLIGGASLVADDFFKICRAAS